MKTWEMIKALTENALLKYKSQDGYVASVRRNGTLALKSPTADRDALGGAENMRISDLGPQDADEWSLLGDKRRGK